MQRDNETPAPDVTVLGTASTDTQGGPVGFIELTGLQRASGISED